MRFALLLCFMAITVTVWGQRANVEKMSISTQMFLDQLEGKANFDVMPSRNLNISGTEPERMPSKYERPFSTPDTIDGKIYISAFIRIGDESGISSLEEKGVIDICTFGNGLLTAFIPVERIDEVANLEVVTRIEAATPMQPMTDKAREATNVDDVLSLSIDAISAGLPKQYDGRGVVLGVIDSGIDYQHIAFKDSEGNSRIVGAYCYDGQSVTADWTDSGVLPTTDDAEGDHGTHTSSAAGGSSVIINGSSVTVTDDHANATYGGMAPGSDLYLAGIYELNDTYIARAFKKIVHYADSVGKPVVITNSWGSHISPHDGTGSVADIISNYFGENYPNHICLFSAGNTSGSAPSSEGGGCHLVGTASSNNPLRTIMRYYGYGGNYYSGVFASAWCRSASVSNMGCRIYVLNTNTGNILTTVNVNPTTNGATVSGLSSYYSGTLYAYKDYLASNKTQILLYSSGLQSTSSDTYTLAVEFYPTDGEAVIDVWGGNSGYFTGFLTTSGHEWTAGTDNGGMGDYATIPQVISVGAYVTKNRITDYNGNTYAYSYTLGDIANFSSYGTPDMTPTGLLYPWITAPGARTVAAVNHYCNSYITGDRAKDRVNASTSNPYGAMQGTSMSTPVAAGIVAVWLQVASENGLQMTPDDIKRVMKETAIQDDWTTTGSHADRFGNGKIDALAGVEYILNLADAVLIQPSSSELTYHTAPHNTVSKQVVVNGRNLTGNITATLNDPSNVFGMSVSGSSGTKVNGQTLTLNAGDVLDISYSPRGVGTHTGTITLTSDGAQAVTITLNGIAEFITEKTLFDGTEENYFLPIFGYYYDEKQVNQMIYPASELTEFEGKTLKSMTFYSPHIYFSGGRFNVKVGTTNQSTYPSTLSSIVRLTPGDMKVVAANQVATAGGTTMTIEFDPNNPFVYEGGNLLVDFEVTETGNYGGSNDAITYFYGVNQSSYTAFNSHADASSSVNANGIYGTSNSNYNYSGARQFLPKVTIVAEVPAEPALSVAPTEVAIEDETDADRTATVDVIAENLDGLNVMASNHWLAQLAENDTKLNVTYQGHALHQVGSATLTGTAGQTTLTANVSADYLYTGPIYIVGDVNNIGWTTSNGHCNGVEMNRDDDGVYTATVTAQAGGEGKSWIYFTKSLNASSFNDLGNYRFGPESNGNWGLHTDYIDNRDQMCPLDTTANLNTIYMEPNKTYRIVIDSKTNQFMIHECKIGVLTSDMLTVKVYHSDLQVGENGGLYTASDVAGDVDRHLAVGDGSQTVDILVKGDNEITRYDLKRKIGDEGSWTVVALAQHEGNTFLPQNSDHSSQGAAVSMPTGANEMWMTLKDDDPVSNVVTYYVPVTVANGVVTTGNTYGAPIQSTIMDKVSLMVSISGSKSDQRWGGHWEMNGKDYCVYTPVITIESSDFDNQVRRPILFRAWLISDDAWDFARVDNAITATTKFTNPHLLGEYIVPADQTDVHYVVIGEDWDRETDWNTKLDNAFAAPSLGADVNIVVRAYYENVASQLRDGEAKYRIAEQGTNGIDLPTSVIEIVGSREVIGVTYVNSVGQASEQPFEGVNIVVTRYSDGSVSTTKILR